MDQLDNLQAKRTLEMNTNSTREDLKTVFPTLLIKGILTSSDSEPLKLVNIDGLGAAFSLPTANGKGYKLCTCVTKVSELPGYMVSICLNEDPVLLLTMDDQGNVLQNNIIHGEII